MTLFSAKNITAGYGEKVVVSDVSFELDGGCVLGIVGANGSGKTTLLKAICGILSHTGESRIQGKILEKESSRQLAKICSYIPQRSGISIDISALDVVLMGFNPYLKLLENPTHEMEQIAREMLSKVGLSGKENTNYMHLSEGQKQLCILARTLGVDSKLLLLDEPESALDFQHRYKMLNLIRDWVNDNERCVIVTLHDPALALNYCDKLLVLSEGSVLDIINPRSDSIQSMEAVLSKIYGKVSLQYCMTQNCQKQLVMLKEEEGWM